MLELQNSLINGFESLPKVFLGCLQKEEPGKTFIPRPTDLYACNGCRQMKINILEKLRDALDFLQPEILIPEDIRVEAEQSVRRSLALSQ